MLHIQQKQNQTYLKHVLTEQSKAAEAKGLEIG